MVWKNVDIPQCGILKKENCAAKALIDKILIKIADYSIGQDQFDEIMIMALRRKATFDEGLLN